MIFRLVTFCSLISFCLSTNECIGQTFFSFRLVGITDLYYKAQIEGTYNGCVGNGSCNFELIGPPDDGFWGGITMSPAGDLYGLNSAMNNTDSGIFLYDTVDGSATMILDLLDWPAGPNYTGLVTIGGGIFYAAGNHTVSGPDSLYEININSGQITNLGFIPFEVTDDIALMNGEFYMHDETPPETGIVKLDISNPENSTMILPTSVWLLQGMTASGMCNTLIATRQVTNPNWTIIYIHLGDGTITTVCSTPEDLLHITSMREHMAPNCEISIDLDCDDSSGAIDFDFDSDPFTCLSGGVPVTDDDIGMVYDLIIDEMTIELTGILPDAPFEILNSLGSIANINVSGNGTGMITLSNAGGAKSTDFKDALRLIRYQNNSSPLTGGLRTVEVQFTTTSGAESNIAIAYIQVMELPLVPVDLGADLQLCDGETITLDAGNAGAQYEWSTGEDNQSISIDQSGVYSVTVMDGINCPGVDSVELEILPVINVSLSGDTEICDNEPVKLTITTDTPFSLSIDIASNPGSPFSFPDINGNYSFTDLISEQTTYTITSVVPSQDACVNITGPEHIVDVYPTFNQTIDVSICEGDSVWLGFYWETEAGVYENTFQSLDGCDSLVTTTIIVSTAITIQTQSTTCDSSEVGVNVIIIDNPNGCDTIVQNSVTLAPSDTTLINTSSCILANTGVSLQTLTNFMGCDSLVIITTFYLPPSDTTMIEQTTCDSAQVGVWPNILTGADGCDSLIIATILLAPSDTTYTSATSCDSSQWGTMQFILTGVDGCDSLIISTVSVRPPDTIYINTTSCDSTTLGVLESHFNSSIGCDSVVFITITYALQDSTFLVGTTCSPGDAGVFVTEYVNQFGCDSIVSLTVSLLTSDSIFVNSNTCDPDLAGIFINQLQNQNGCDSIVTETVSLLPSSTTFLSSNTCVAAEAGVFVVSLINQYGCDSVITETITLTLSDTITITKETCDPAQTGITETLFSGADGCDSLVIESTSLFPLPVLELESLHDYNGFDISCEGGSDGSVMAIVIGTPPITYEWSTGDNEQLMTGLSAGDYHVNITDSNGCPTSGSITLLEPSPFMISFEISEPDCFENGLGSIQVLGQGGVTPYTFSIDGTIFQADPIFENLNDGIYQITALDANDCSTTQIISIHVPLSIQVELGEDQIIQLGDSAQINAVVNLPFDSIASVLWTGIENIDCPNCLTQIVAPIITTAYTISVNTADGCADKDSMSVFVSTDHDIYIPNIFSPNDDGINDVLTISTGGGVEEITSFSIFDRWGDLVFSREHIQPDDPTVSWDGRFDGRSLNPGVFTYKVNIRYHDGATEVRYGDVTLLK